VEVQTRSRHTAHCELFWTAIAVQLVRLRLKCDGTCAETIFRLTAFEMWWHMRRNHISLYRVWNVMAHAQKPYFVLPRLKCDGTCAETIFRLTAFEMWWHMRRNHISSYCILKCDGTRAETRFRLSAKRTSPFKSAGASVQSTTVSRGVCISGSNAGYTMFRGSVKSTGYPFYSPVSPSLPHPCVTVCHHISNGLYQRLCTCPVGWRVFIRCFTDEVARCKQSSANHLASRP